MTSALYAPTVLLVYRFRFRDPLTHKWVKVRSQRAAWGPPSVWLLALRTGIEPVTRPQEGRALSTELATSSGLGGGSSGFW